MSWTDPLKKVRRDCPEAAIPPPREEAVLWLISVPFNVMTAGRSAAVFLNHSPPPDPDSPLCAVLSDRRLSRNVTAPPKFMSR